MRHISNGLQGRAFRRRQLKIGEAVEISGHSNDQTERVRDIKFRIPIDHTNFTEQLAGNIGVIDAAKWSHVRSLNLLALQLSYPKWVGTTIWQDDTAWPSQLKFVFSLQYLKICLLGLY